MQSMMTEKEVAALAFVVVGLVAGTGMLLVRPPPNEPERLAWVWPLARLYRYRAFRVVVALLCFGSVMFGLAHFRGWL